MSAGKINSLLRIAISFHRFGPYHLARLAACGKRGDVVGLEMTRHDTVYSWDPVLGSQGFRRHTVYPSTDIEEVPPKQVLRDFANALDEIQPDVVAIPGWSHKGALASLSWCSQRGVPAVMMSDSHATGINRPWWREIIKRNILSQCSAGFVAGQPHVEYLCSLGMPRERVFLGYDVVDNQYFETGASLAREKPSENRQRLRIPKNYFLASNRFVGKKNLDGLLKAYSQYRMQAGPEAWDLVLIGDGPLMTKMQQLSDALGLQEHAKFVGFQQYDDLPAFYGLANAFVHSSTNEEWGLVVNEAMAAGLPILASDRCGCTSDLVKSKVNGFVFDPYDLSTMTRAMTRIASGQCDRESMGQASLELISHWTPDTFADKLFQASQAALDAPRKKTGLAAKILLRYVMQR